MPKRAHSERGQVAVFMTMSLIVMLGMLGFVVDTGWAYWRKEAAKTAADAAVMGAVMAAKNAANLTCGSGVTCQAEAACPVSLSAPTNPIHAACLYAQQNGYTNGGAGGRQTVRIAADVTGSPISGVAPSYWVSATVNETLPQTFAAVLGSLNARVTVKSVAGVFAAASGGGCIYVMEPTATGITMSGGGISSNCGVYVNSSSSSAILSSGGSITTSGGSKTNIVGAWLHSGGTISPSPILGAPVQADPFASMTAPSNSGMTNYTGVSMSSGTQTIQPGNYTGSINLSGGTLTLASGLYYLNNGLNISGGTIRDDGGAGVTFYVNGGSFNMSGGSITLNAPTTGTWKGILVFQSRTNTSGINLSGGPQVYSGAVYAKAATLSISGGTYNNTTFVANKINISGGTVGTINGGSISNYTGGVTTVSYLQ